MYSVSSPQPLEEEDEPLESAALFLGSSMLRAE